MFGRTSFLVCAVLFGTVTCFAGPADWAYQGSFATPNFGTAETIGVQRLMTDSAGRLYLSVNAAVPNEYIYRCTAPTTDLSTPTYTLIVQDTGMNNGFQGLACDSSNNFYVMGESGTAGTGQLRKFDSAGTLVTAFGTSGIVTPVARMTGMALLSDGNLVATTFGGALYKYNASTGVESGPFTSALANYTRDLAVKPDAGGNDVIFGTQSGRLKRVTGGSVTNLAGYTTAVDWFTGATPSDSGTSVRPSCYYFGNDDTVIFGNYTDHRVFVVNASTGNVLQTLGDGTNEYGAGQLGGASDVAVTRSGGKDYLYVCTAWPVVQVYSKNTTPVASVNDWSIY
jgi:hypothetical protein